MFLYVTNLCSICIMKACLTCSKAICTCIEMTMWFLFLRLLIWYIIFIYLPLLKENYYLWNGTQLVMIHDILLHYSNFWKYFVNQICIHIYQRNLSIISLFNVVFLSFLLEFLWLCKMSVVVFLHFLLCGNIKRNVIWFSIIVWWNSVENPSGPGVFLCRGLLITVSNSSLAIRVFFFF